MKIKYFTIVALSIIMIFCNAKSISNPDKDSNTHAINNNHQQSILLIERYNRIRQIKNLSTIIQDTILNNVCETLIRSPKYRNADNTFNEDSVRHLLYRSGIIDYQYEIKEVLDKDTTNAFNSFLLVDNSNNIRMGYKKNENKHILFKTKSYLKFNNWMISVHSDAISGFNSNATSASVYTDSTLCYLKILEPDKYYYQFYNRIPLSTENLDNIKKVEIRMLKSENNSTNNEGHDLVIKSTGKETNMFLIISNKSNKRVALIK